MSQQLLIFFCEDCGERNSLTPEKIQNGRVTFKCSSCKYTNSYPVPGAPDKEKKVSRSAYFGRKMEQKSNDSMPEMLRRMVCHIEMLPEVIKAFFFAPSDSMFICSLPENSYQKNKLWSICRLLSNHYSASKSAASSPVKEISLSRSNHIFFYGKLTESLFLGAITPLEHQTFPFDALIKKTTAEVQNHLRSIENDKHGANK
ncbi:hypothetical protein MTBBW1_1210015 [Desulfamplus magnetovallimortis]|uniref:Zinc finger/thioredoxin putative domain-containing protein n=1 Tax=Desulfamplus magnetovallimortis TaxID=1246637 RepID=A0A1W1H6G0_9BACT|nr:hypothetical protein [Desulfamplus magnetovallimortis]SLM27975.1 hypothetical protein MTBBW1_1210015 [Desulfamplus magnetovallimortis]